ncbi:flagellar basal body M-ring protein FliF [Bacillus sp. FJAT-42376]|uniref:flagellar basal-body MS-ring/collar protein FliF n=1 Tax=Bacillus sp. FJAT-42376 TaxID=2014076 RepID=UPI000F4D6FC8|nr:flagellar basal-body MS-ring/collar protein FliF [Bacillus sp. FJAT-42376]AZB42937.1 flagellar basal body M-ring protein FliF [Bacillus sp. FJAT-42376]
MNQKLREIGEKVLQFWRGKSKGQKGMMIGSFLAAVIILSVLAFFLSRPNLVPLYKDLTLEESGQIKETIDGRGIQSEIADNGTTILVPAEMVNSLKVDLAAEGLPETGTIDYSFFGQNVGFGMTDKEFDVLKLKATQTELSNLIRGIEGVKDASVMINMPQETVFVGEEAEQASASIVVTMNPGSKLDQSRVEALYHLVSKSVPNLPADNIVIMDDHFNYFDQNKENDPAVSNYATQHDIKMGIERDLQQQVQKMLGTMIGQDKVVVSVTTDLDFTQENREENLVEPVDKENMQGIQVSAERITEAYTGDGASAAGGTAGTSEGDVPNYQQSAQNGNGNYERNEERINNEVNRIKKQIVESPYKIRDLGIQVMVEPPNPKNPGSIPQGRVDDIKQMLSTIVRTSINKDANAQPISDQDIESKIVVSVQPFAGKLQTLQDTPSAGIPVWVYIGGGVLLAVILLLIFLLFRKRGREEEEYEEEIVTIPLNVPDVNEEMESEGTLRRKQLEKLAKEKPEDFAKLLRTWLSEE